MDAEDRRTFRCVMKRSNMPLARPTLRGLVVEAESPVGATPERVLYPWTCVSCVTDDPGRPYWNVYDENGDVVVGDDGREFRLRAKDRNADYAGLCAQLRCYRRAMQCGELVITERYPAGAAGGSRKGTLTSVELAKYLLGLLVLFGSVIVYVFRHGLPTWPLTDYQILVGIFLVMAVLTFGAPGVLIYIASARGRKRKPNVAAARFDATGMEADFLDGRRVRLTWDRLAGIQWTAPGLMRASFTDQSVLWFGPCDAYSRTTLVLTLANRRVHPEAATKAHAQWQRETRLSYVRIGMYSIVGGLVTGGFVYRFGPEGQHPFRWLLFALLVAAVGPVCVLVFGVIGPRLNGAWARRRQRGKRRRMMNQTRSYRSAP